MLLGIMAGVAAPRYQRAMDYAALQAASKRLAADLRHAQQQARSRTQSVAIEFSTNTDTYQAAEAYQAVLVDPDRPGSGLSVRLSDRVTMTSASFDGRPLIEFDFRGDPVSPGSVELSSRTQTATVSVNALGVVEVAP